MRNNILKYSYFVILSYFIFIITPIICYLLIDYFDLFKDPLTKFGLSENTNFIWIIFSLFFNLFLYVNSKVLLKRNNIKNKILNVILKISLYSLLISTIFINFNYIHSITAFIYFLIYPFFIFTYGFFIKKRNYKLGLFSIIISALCLILPIITLYFFKGLGIPEITHSILVLIWSFKLINARNNII